MDENTERLQELTTEKRTMAINDLKGALAKSIQSSSTSVAGLQNALKLYSDAMNDYVALKMEQQAILDKYISKPSGSYSSAYHLPGVFATSMASYDINAAKTDNQRMTELNDLIEESEHQKDYYYDNLVTIFNDLVNSLQKLRKYDGAIIEYLILMQQMKEL